MSPKMKIYHKTTPILPISPFNQVPCVLILTSILRASPTAYSNVATTVETEGVAVGGIGSLGD
jgi:hypothetical protein